MASELSVGSRAPMAAAAGHAGDGRTRADACADRTAACRHCPGRGSVIRYCRPSPCFSAMASRVRSPVPQFIVAALAVRCAPSASYSTCCRMLRICSRQPPCSCGTSSRRCAGLNARSQIRRLSGAMPSPRGSRGGIRPGSAVRRRSPRRDPHADCQVKENRRSSTISRTTAHQATMFVAGIGDPPAGFLPCNEGGRPAGPEPSPNSRWSVERARQTPSRDRTQLDVLLDAVVHGQSPGLRIATVLRIRDNATKGCISACWRE